MKASEVKVAGFYWYRRPGKEWTVVNADDWLGPGEWSFTYTGGEMLKSAKEMPGDFIGPLTPPTTTTKGCGKKLAGCQYWTFCGETDMGQTDPALCVECGGSFKLP